MVQSGYYSGSTWVQVNSCAAKQVCFGGVYPLDLRHNFLPWVGHATFLSVSNGYFAACEAWLATSFHLPPCSTHVSVTITVRARGAP